MGLRASVIRRGIWRVLGRLAVCGALGLLCTVVTTVVATQYADPYNYRVAESLTQLSTPTEEPGQVLRSMVRSYRFLGGREYILSPVDVVDEGERRDLAPPIQPADLPSWVDHPEQERVGVTAIGFGEPFTCAAWNMHFPMHGFFSSEDPVPRPVWAGVAITTLMWAGVWCGVITGVPAARRWCRVRRGLCAVCAYDLRGLVDAVCPECGAGAGVR